MIQSAGLDRIQALAQPSFVKIADHNAPDSAELSFADVLKKIVSDVSHLQDEARNAIEAFVRGEPVELHQVMAAAEEASLSLEVLVELRNRLVDAFRTVVTMH